MMVLVLVETTLHNGEFGWEIFGCSAGFLVAFSLRGSDRWNGRCQELSEKNIVYRDPGWQCRLGDENIGIFQMNFNFSPPVR